MLKNGAIIASAEEERFRRIKHWAGFPSKAIKYCLSEAWVGLVDVMIHVAINQDAKANLWKKISFTMAKRPDLGMVIDRILYPFPIMQVLRISASKIMSA